jgi:hypothetical protein
MMRAQMARDAVIAASAVALTNVGLGWYLGYRSFTAYLAFWLLSAFVVAASVRLARGAFGASGLADTIVRSAVVAFALIVLGGLTLGSVGAIAPGPYLLFFAGCLALSWLIGAGNPRHHEQRDTEPMAGVDLETARYRRTAAVVIAAVLVPALVFVVAVGLIESPLTLYDSLSYHLLFPARWLQEHRLSIVPTPFSDEAQAYAPANGELFFLWLMVPFHGDLLARIGQLPFYLLGGITLYALARRMGARPAHAVYAPAFFFLSKPIVEQAVGADVDLICAATFLTSLYIGVAAVDSNARRDWVLWGISLGLYWGSKYVSLVYTPIFLLLPLMRGPRRQTLWAVPGILLLAMPWYLRNWAVAGSPIYPSSLTVAGLTVAQGAYSRAAMMNSVFHTTDLRLLPVAVSHAFGTALFMFWLPFALVGAWAMLTARPRWPSLFLLCTPLAMAPLFWLAVPDNIDSRFLLPAAAVAILPFAFAFRPNRVWNAGVHVVFAAGLLWIVFGWRGELPVALPWFMAGWLSLDGIVARGYLLPFVALAGIAGWLVASLLPRQPGRAVAFLAALVGASVMALAAGARTWCGPEHCTLLQISPTYVRPTLLAGWRWVAEHINGATIAYSGNNVPYPLFGDRLANRVYYVNIDHHAGWRFHDYDRAHRRRRDDTVPPSALAVSSGVLQPLPGPARWWADAVRPRYQRMEGQRDAWIQNLKSRGVRYLFVSALSAYEIDYVWHNDGGFPIEDDWARFDAAAFTLLYENPQVKLFAVHPR